MKINAFLIEHLGIQRVVVVIFDISDLKNDIPDPVHRSWGGYLKH